VSLAALCVAGVALYMVIVVAKQEKKP